MKKIGLLTILSLTFTSFASAQTLKEYFERGLAAYKNKQYAEAITNYTQALKFNANASEIWFNRGQSYYFSGNLELAIADYSQTLKLKATYLDAWFQRGLAYNKKGNHDAAIADYSQGLQLAPNDAQLWYNRGIAYMNKESLDAALSDYDQAIKLNPNYVKAFVNRGSVYFKKKLYAAAIADLTTALKLDPNYAEAWDNRGVCYNTLNQPDAAIADFNQALKIDPNYAKAYLDRSISYNKKGQNDLAITDLNQAIKLNANFVGAYVFRGAIYYDLRKFDLSKADMEKVLQLSPSHKLAAETLAKINNARTTTPPTATLNAKSQAVWTGVSPTKAMESNVLLIGEEKGQRLPLCRAAHSGGLHPGKVVNGRCHIGFAGAEMNVETFEVLTLSANPAFSLSTSNNGERFIVGVESNGQPLYLCSAAYQNSTHPGKIVNGQCNITWGGKEVSVASFQTYYLTPKTAMTEDQYFSALFQQFQAGQNVQVIQTANACLTAFPKAVNCLSLRGQAYGRTAASKGIDTKKLMNTRAGDKMEEDADWIKAIADLSQVIQLVAGRVEPYINRATVYLDGYNGDDYVLALEDLKKALSIDPNHAQAKSLIKRAQSSAGSSYTSQGIRLFSRRAFGETDPVKLAASDAVVKEAVAAFTKAVAINDNFHLRKLRSEAYLHLKQYDLALADLTESLRLKPMYPEAIRLRATLYLAQKKPELALADYQTLLAMPDNNDTKYEKGYALADRADYFLKAAKYDLAIADFSKLIAGNPEHGVAIYGRGMAYFKQGNRTAAAADFERAIAISLDPQELKKQLARDGIPPYNAQTTKPAPTGVEADRARYERIMAQLKAGQTVPPADIEWAVKNEARFKK